MKANELQLNDLVRAGGCITPVKVLRQDNHRNIGAESSYGLVFYKDEEIEPIPLTAEILEKNGWIYVLTENEYRSPEDKSFGEAFRLQAGEDKNHFWWIEGITLIHPINYVHTLQHALRLCGLEELADNFKI